ncbi:MAG: NAD-dependent epimerase/dehydratase family protein, partial [Saprospiraceae bacterium]|nr:NAD-dependent epimerase/dehydratase family protein [Saprospiraceae bacterium]
MKSSAPPRRIFITGATGLVGAHIIALLLARGYRHITALKRTASPMDLVAAVKDQVTWIEGDLRDQHALMEGMRDADWVIHAAAYIAQGRS